MSPHLKFTGHLIRSLVNEAMSSEWFTEKVNSSYVPSKCKFLSSLLSYPCLSLFKTRTYVLLSKKLVVDTWWLVSPLAGYYISYCNHPSSSFEKPKITQINRQAVTQFLDNLLKNWTDLICPQNVYFYPVRKAILASVNSTLALMAEYFKSQ